MKYLPVLFLFILISCSSNPYSARQIKNGLSRAKGVISLQMSVAIDTLYRRQMEAFEWPDRELADSTRYRDSVVFSRTAVQVGEWILMADRRGQFYFGKNRKKRKQQ